MTSWVRQENADIFLTDRKPEDLAPADTPPLLVRQFSRLKPSGRREVVIIIVTEQMLLGKPAFNRLS